MKALIVEDDREEASFVSTSLAAKGFRCRRVASGEAGLQELTANSFDIAIIDEIGRAHV